MKGNKVFDLDYFWMFWMFNTLHGVGAIINMALNSGVVTTCGSVKALKAFNGSGLITARWCPQLQVSLPPVGPSKKALNFRGRSTVRDRSIAAGGARRVGE
jgi:hypothetical protein